MTQTEKELANKIYESIQIIITSNDRERLNLKTLDEEIEYTRKEKMRITIERLKKKGIII